jgi:hypothetical protein
MVNSYIHKHLPLDSILRHLGVVNNFTTYSFNIHFNIILKFKPGSPPPPNVTVEHSCVILRRPRLQISAQISVIVIVVFHGLSPSHLINSGIEPQNTSKPLLYKNCNALLDNPTSVRRYRSTVWAMDKVRNQRKRKQTEQEFKGIQYTLNAYVSQKKLCMTG